MKKYTLLLGTVLLLVVGEARAQSNPSIDWSWTKAPWKENDKPFATARKQLFQLSKQKKITVERVENFKRLSDKDPWNPQKQFRFAYSAYLLDKKQPKARTLLTQATQALADSQLTSLHAPPRPVLAYNFCRLRFLLTARELPFRELLPAGERILQREPNDYLVKYYVATLLEMDNPAEKARKLRLINEMIKSHPKDPAPRLLLGNSVSDIWLFSGKRSDAQNAIATYQRIKAMKPALIQVTTFADEAITRIAKSQARREKRRPERATQ